MDPDSLKDLDAPAQEPMRPLKILQLKPQSSEVEIISENLDAISRNLQQSGATVVSIVAVMGTYRTGKSFLLDLLMRYFKRRVSQTADGQYCIVEATAPSQGAGAPPQPHASRWRAGNPLNKAPPPEWMLEGDRHRIAEGSKSDTNADGFAWRPGKDKCTQGIWLWSSPFVVTDPDGRQVAVLLMDTQGAWDDTMTKSQSATIFGMTALLSSKLIYNIQNRVEEDKLENLDYITTFAQTVCSELPGTQAPFGHLELLVRDWANFEDGFTVEQCQEQMLEHMDDHLSPQKVPEDAVPRVERLRNAFRSIGCFGLPHPGLKVTKPQYTGEISAIDGDFLHLLDAFTSSCFGDGFPQPSAPLGCEITVGSFKQIVLNFAEVFRENAPDMAIGLREAFVKVEMMTCRDEMLRRFREHLERIAPDTTVLDPVLMHRDTEKIKDIYLQEFQTKLRPWRMNQSEEARNMEEIAQAIGSIVNARVLQNDTEVEGATMKLMASPLVGCGGYILLVHHLILMGVMGVGGYCHMKKWSVKNDVELTDPAVFQGVYADARKFGLQRWKDVQAIQIAMQRFNPNDAVDTVMKASMKAGTLLSVASAGAAEAVGQPMSSNHRPGAMNGGMNGNGAGLQLNSPQRH